MPRKSCKHGPDSPRFANRRCIACSQERNRAYCAQVSAARALARAQREEEKARQQMEKAQRLEEERKTWPICPVCGSPARRFVCKGRCWEAFTLDIARSACCNEPRAYVIGSREVMA